MPRAQIFRSPETGKPLWAVIHDLPLGSDQQSSETRTDLVDQIATVLSKVTGEDAVVLAAGDMTVEVI